MDKKLKRGTYYECLKCGDKIYYNTDKKMVYCKCEAIAIDGCEHYTRIITPPDDKYGYRSIYIDEEGEIKKFMKYIIFDLEATCWEIKNDKVKEVIEIGAVKLNENLETADTFSEFVKPTINPELTDFCKTLTSIKQEDVDNAKTFNDAIRDFERWIFSMGDEVKLISWGYYDKKQMLEESTVKNYSGEIIKLLEENHISLKHEFARLRKSRTCGMKKALDILHLPLEGTHHRGIDDAKNIAEIFKAIYPDLPKLG
jgi:inhibitor of KinA sporulation pathway (predicted exonuclease)